jgi:hypothetical protein
MDDVSAKIIFGIITGAFNSAFPMHELGFGTAPPLFTTHQIADFRLATSAS